MRGIIPTEFSGLGWSVVDSRNETVDTYKVSQLRLVNRDTGNRPEPPPWQDLAPPLETYRERGHRRLSVRTYQSRCMTCIWGCRMPVEMIIDKWNPSYRRYRVETFCYGPVACKHYKPGPARRVPGRHGMTYVEEDWVDEDAVSGRGPGE